MSQTIRFPNLKARPGLPEESRYVITLLNGVDDLLVGGAEPYVSTAPWKIDANLVETPFTCVVIEFTAALVQTIGNGTNPIGLFGLINDASGAPSIRTLLGVLGLNFAATTVPQIPIVARANASLVGFSQVVSNVSAYDALMIGGVTGNIALTENSNLVVTARPIICRDWVG